MTRQDSLAPPAWSPTLEGEEQFGTLEPETLLAYCFIGEAWNCWSLIAVTAMAFPEGFVSQAGSPCP